MRWPDVAKLSNIYPKSTSSAQRTQGKEMILQILWHRGVLCREGNNGAYSSPQNVPLRQLPTQQNLPRQISSTQSELVTVEGVVKTIPMENKMSGYLVAKIKVRILKSR